MSVFGIVYVASNLRNGKVYVGQTTRSLANRWSVHKSEAKRRARSYFHKAIVKHGADVFAVDEVAIATDQGQLDRLESLWIVALAANQRGYGYNLSIGGEHPKPTAEVKRKLSDAAKLRDHSKLHAAAGWAKGKHFSNDHKRNLSIANKGNKPSIGCRRAVAEANRKRVYSDETRAKLRLAAAKANMARWGNR